MALSVGIIGLPNVGKSTLFNALTANEAETANYPFCTIEPNVGVVAVPDTRLPLLAERLNKERRVPSTIRFVDIAGLVQGASKGEGLGNRFLSHIRETDVLVHVVRCFDGEDITHVGGQVNPVADIAAVETELVLSDLETVEQRLEKTEKLLKAKDKLAQQQKPLLAQLAQGLNQGRLAGQVLSPEELQPLQPLNLLTAKPMLYAANISEAQLQRPSQSQRELEIYAREQGVPLVHFAAQLEAEVARLDAAERQDFLQDFGLEQSGLDQLVSAAFRLLSLITFFTYNELEVRAWEVPQGTSAQQAAGKIHTDMARGFIRADILNWQDLLEYGDIAAARQQGAVRSEGKEYTVRDGDVIYFQFRG